MQHCSWVNTCHGNTTELNELQRFIFNSNGVFACISVVDICKHFKTAQVVVVDDFIFFIFEILTSHVANNQQLN